MEGDSDEAPSVGSPSHAPPSKWKAWKRNARLHFLHSIGQLLPMYGSSESRDLRVSNAEPQVIVGPVIGEVTATIARILIEIDTSMPLTIEIQVQPPALENQPSFLRRQLTGGRRGARTKSFKSSDEVYGKSTIQKDVTAKPSCHLRNSAARSPPNLSIPLTTKLIHRLSAFHSPRILVPQLIFSQSSLPFPSRPLPSTTQCDESLSLNVHQTRPPALRFLPRPRITSFLVP